MFDCVVCGCVCIVRVHVYVCVCAHAVEGVSACWIVLYV